LNYKTLQNILQTDYLTKLGGFNGRKKMTKSLSAEIKKATSFLNYDAPIFVRVSYILNNVAIQKQCEECDSKIEHNVSVSQASDFCSIKCSKRSQRTKDKRNATNLKRYGVSNPFSDSEKIQHAVYAKYGVTNVSHLDNVKDIISKKNTENASSRMAKTKATVQQLYNADWYSKTPKWKEKTIATNNMKFDADWTFQSKAIQDQIKETNLERYGADNPSKNVDVINKIATTKQEQYGDPKFNNTKKTKQTMNDRFGCHSQQTHWNKSTLDIMQNDTLLKDFVLDKTITQAADELGVAPTTLRNTLQSKDIDFYIKRKNQYETFISDILDYHNINYITSDRKILNPKELDFVLPDHNIAIECNGIFWHSELMGKGRNYHIDKTLACQHNGIQLIHIWDYQIDSKLTIVNSMINHLIGKTQNRISARQTTIVEIGSNDYYNFLNDNHLQGPVYSSTRIGLEFNGKLVAVMGAGKSRFKTDEYEMHRLAFLNNHLVIGGASKLFKHLLNMEVAPTIISYANQDHSTGGIYDTLGFKQVGMSGPTYQYFKNRKVENRIKYQKHKLASLLEHYDASLSEWKNMQNDGFNRFWTTGNIKYEYRT